MAKISFSLTTPQLLNIIVWNFISLIDGAYYASASYISKIKAITHFSQTDINIIGASSLTGACASLIFVGFLLDRFPRRLREQAFLYQLLGAGGYLGMYISLTYYPTSTTVPTLAIYMGLVSFCALSITNIIRIALFSACKGEDHRLIAVHGSLLVSCYLGGLIFMLLFKYVWHSTEISIMFLMFTCLTAGCCTLMAFFGLKADDFQPGDKESSVNDDSKGSKHSESAQLLPKEQPSSLLASFKDYVLGLPDPPLIATILFALYNISFYFFNMGKGADDDVGVSVVLLLYVQLFFILLCCSLTFAFLPERLL